MLVVVPDAGDEDSYLPQMLAAGYELRVREPGFEQNRMFRTPERDVHVHVFTEGAGEIDRYLLFRDFLRETPDARRRYETLKRELSEAERADMNAYAYAKTELVEGITLRDRARP